MSLNDIQPEYMTRAEVQERLRISSPTMFRWVKEGNFPKGIKFGQKNVWPVAVVEGWIAAQSAKAQGHAQPATSTAPSHLQRASVSTKDEAEGPYLTVTVSAPSKQRLDRMRQASGEMIPDRSYQVRIP